jgi:hypothetical protein
MKRCACPIAGRDVACLAAAEAWVRIDLGDRHLTIRDSEIAGATVGLARVLAGSGDIRACQGRADRWVARHLRDGDQPISWEIVVAGCGRPLGSHMGVPA